MVFLLSVHIITIRCISGGGMEETTIIDSDVKCLPVIFGCVVFCLCFGLCTLFRIFFKRILFMFSSHATRAPLFVICTPATISCDLISDHTGTGFPSAVRKISDPLQ